MSFGNKKLFIYRFLGTYQSSALVIKMKNECNSYTNVNVKNQTTTITNSNKNRSHIIPITNKIYQKDISIYIYMHIGYIYQSLFLFIFIFFYHHEWFTIHDTISIFRFTIKEIFHMTVNSNKIKIIIIIHVYN